MKWMLFFLMSSVAWGLGANVIFVHPDGAGISHWQAARFYLAGPDAELNWDRLPHIAVYRGHMADALSATSNGGATSHAYGVKVPAGVFGTDGVSAGPAMSASGKRQSIMHEAMEQGIRTGLVNSGSIIEPGTACFVASAESRKNGEEITRQVVESGVDVILSGGEEWFLPVGTKGRHGGEGRRADGRNLADWARENGYAVVYTREELEALPEGTRRVLGIFANEHTFHDMGEAELRTAGLPTYLAVAPTVGEMTSAALRFLSPGPFLLVVEEEGSDNFANYNNGQGTLDALKRADEAIGVAMGFVEKHPDTLLVTTADSSAGAMDVLGFVPTPERMVLAMAGRDLNGAPYSVDPEGRPFLSQPDKAGRRHPFVLVWGTKHDSSGGILVRAIGKNASKVTGSFDNTGIYTLMRETLFEN